MTEHEGTQYCRFLAIQDFYIELVDIGNYQAFLKVCSKEGELPHVTGLSFGLKSKEKGDLKRHFEKIKGDFDGHGINYQHKNYRWKEDKNSNLPRWNFMNFREAVIPDMEIWFTEYEDDPMIKDRRKSLKADHENSVCSVHSVILDISGQEEKVLSQLVDSKFEKGICSIGEVSEIRNYAVLGADRALFSSKKSAFKAVVLKASNWSRFLRSSGLNEQGEIFNRPYCHIQFHNHAYDLVIIPVLRREPTAPGRSTQKTSL